MSLPNIWSRRNRAEQEGEDVFQYEFVSPKLRVQLWMNMCIVTKQLDDDYAEDPWPHVVDLLREEIGVHQLVPGYFDSKEAEVGHWLMDIERAKTARILDCVELWYRFSKHADKNNYNKAKTLIQMIVGRINGRFKEDGLGFQLVDGEIVKVSNELLHAEVILPTLKLLSEVRFATANGEFRKAFSEYKAGSYEDCLVDCLKSLESVLKVIGKKRGWVFNETDPASKLIASAFAADFIPPYMQTQFAALRTMLESSVPTTRNKQGGHGSGNEPRNVPEHLAAFQLHQTASILVFLGECDRLAP